MSEIKLTEKKIEVLRWKLGLTNLLSKPSVGRSGGIALFWGNGVDVSLQSLSKYFIDVEIGRGTDRWRFTGIYGESRSDKRILLGKLYVSYGTTHYHGYAWAISTRSCSNMKNKVGVSTPSVYG